MPSIFRFRANDFKKSMQWRGKSKTIYNTLKNYAILALVSLKKSFKLGHYPDFIISGVMKGGTTSLHQYLLEHPSIQSGFRKEVHFFDLSFDQGKDWYKAFFPIFKQEKITGEASPYYIFHPLAIERMHKVCPQAKLILVLRNPIDRAFSQHTMEIMRLREDKSFEEAIALEEERLKGLKEKIINGKDARNYATYAYLARGRYIEQLQNLFKYFKREQVLILKSEDLFADPQKECSKAFEFLGLPDHQINKPKKFNPGKYKQKMKPETRKKLNAYFKPYNKKLYNLLNKDFGWN